MTADAPAAVALVNRIVSVVSRLCEADPWVTNEGGYGSCIHCDSPRTDRRRHTGGWDMVIYLHESDCVWIDAMDNVLGVAHPYHEVYVPPPAPAACIICQLTPGATVVDHEEHVTRHYRAADAAGLIVHIGFDEYMRQVHRRWANAMLAREIVTPRGGITYYPAPSIHDTHRAFDVGYPEADG